MGKGFGRKNNIHISREIPAKRINENSHGDAHFKFKSSTAYNKNSLAKEDNVLFRRPFICNNDTFSSCHYL
jgi:hypothetical protein